MMKSIDLRNPVQRTGASVLSLLLLLIPAALLGTWIYTFQSNQSLSQAEKVELYQNYLPGFIANNSGVVGLAACIVSFVIAMLCVRYSKSLLRGLNIATLIIATLLLALQVFGLM